MCFAVLAERREPRKRCLYGTLLVVMGFNEFTNCFKSVIEEYLIAKKPLLTSSNSSAVSLSPAKSVCNIKWYSVVADARQCRKLTMNLCARLFGRQRAETTELRRCLSPQEPP